MINKQIQLLNPDIIICGNTFQIIKEDFGNPTMIKYNSVKYTTFNNKLIINAYHPAQRTITREQYVNDIINCVKEWVLAP